MNEDFEDEDGPDEDGLLSKGEMSLKNLDDANVPVDIWLSTLTEEEDGGNEAEHEAEYKQGYRFRLTCGAYMPRKGSVYESAVECFSKDLETMQKAITKYIVPFYEIAMAKIKGMAEKGEGNLYYWSKDE